MGLPFTQQPRPATVAITPPPQPQCIWGTTTSTAASHLRAIATSSSHASRSRSAACQVDRAGRCSRCSQLPGPHPLKATPITAQPTKAAWQRLQEGALPHSMHCWAAALRQAQTSRSSRLRRSCSSNSSASRLMSAAQGCVANRWQQSRMTRVLPPGTASHPHSN